MKTQAGFTIFELVIVLVMVGLLTAGLVPLLTAQHARSMDQDEREALVNARAALIGYALSRNGFPAPLTSAADEFDPSMRPVFPPGWVITGTNRNESYLPWGNAHLGVNPFGAYRKYFWYDVRADLLEIPNVSPPNFCSRVQAAMSADAAAPFVCLLPTVEQDTTPCPGGTANASSAAFTLVSFGSDMAPNMAHASLNLLATPPVRNYENPARAINRTRLAASSPFYDDMVVSLSLAELVRECQVNGHLAATGTGTPTQTRQLSVVVANTSSADAFLRDPGNVCHEIYEGDTMNFGPFPETSIITIHHNYNTCDNNTSPRGNDSRQPLSALDSNNDSQVRFTCPGGNTTTCTTQ